MELLLIATKKYTNKPIPITVTKSTSFVCMLPYLYGLFLFTIVDYFYTIRGSVKITLVWFKFYFKSSKDSFSLLVCLIPRLGSWITDDCLLNYPMLNIFIASYCDLDFERFGYVSYFWGLFCSSKDRTDWLRSFLVFSTKRIYSSYIPSLNLSFL